MQQESSVDIDYENMTLKEAVEKFEKTIIKRALDVYGSTYKAVSYTHLDVYKRQGINLRNEK